MSTATATSIQRLIRIGLFSVALPLAAGMVAAIWQIEALLAETRQTLQVTTDSIATARSLVTAALNMERLAGQYAVLADPALIERYRRQRLPFTGWLSRLAAAPSDPAVSEQITALRQWEQALFRQLRQPPPETAQAAPAIDLYGPANQLQLAINNQVAARAGDLAAHANRVQRLLWLQATLLIPLAIALVLVLGSLLSRPLGQLGAAIRRLSAGMYHEPVVVGGLADTRELGQRLDHLRGQLADLEQQKLTFLQHMSHELKTPLTSLREGISLLADEVTGPLTATQREVVGILEHNGEQLQKEVGALLDFNQALRDERLRTPEPLALAALVQAAIERQRLNLRAKSLRAATDLAPLSVIGDSGQLGVVMDNLLSNAIKYSPPGSTIDISLHNTDQRAALEVRDHGPGIPAAEADKVFQAFYQGAQARRGSVAGTGLGLAIARRYATLHGGELRLLPGRGGARFALTLPLAEGER